MGKGFYISKVVGIVGIVVAAGAVAAIIALSVVYTQERNKNSEGQAIPTTGVPPTGPVETTAQSNDPWHKYRLPDTLVPDSYDITLWPRLEPDEHGMYIFTGNSTVTFKCVKETNLILIHCNKLNLTADLMLTAVGETSAPGITSHNLVTKTQYLVIHLDGHLNEGESYKLFTSFQGELADDLGGFYRSEYTETGLKKVLATTQMQATDARKAFPCFDEPALKAYFTITLLHPPSTKAISNGKESGPTDEVIDGVSVWKTTFEKTKRMSTYLVAFIVSEFDSVQTTEVGLEGNLMIRIFARSDAIKAGHGDYALNITGPILKFFEEYYNISYPLSKSDQVALPDFSAGAMENWGLITYRETALLYDPEMSSNGNKERIASVIAHELAHMWFGNLVTIRWWNDLWLNEGFATYVEYLGADRAEPTWDIKDLIVLNDVHRVFALDALASSHPLSSLEDEVLTPAQISEVFDAISYSKGGSVLRMLSDFLTEDVFVKGLNSYLNHFQYNNTIYSDLWDHLQMAVDQTGTPPPFPIADIMDRWVLQMGFPVVTLNTATGSLSQEHFLLDPESVVDRPSPFNYEWMVPIQWTKNGAQQTKFWLGKKEDQNNEMKVTEADWVVLNLNVTGYYRVNYDPGNWEKLINKLSVSHGDIAVLNRVQIIDDAFNLARATILPTTLALNTTQYLSAEREYMPWQSALNNLDYFYLMLDRTEVFGPLQDYMRQQVEPLFSYFKDITGNWAGVPEGHMDQYNEVNALRMACSTGVTECVDLVKGWYREYMDDSSINKIHPNLRYTVYCQAIAAGDAKEWDFAFKMYKEAKIAIEADKLRSAMACSKVPWILNRYLSFTLNQTHIRKQDATATIVAIANNVVGQPLAWDFVRANWAYIFNEYGGGSFSFANLINGVTKRFASEFELKELEDFRDDNADVGFGSGTMAIEQSIERTKANMKWLALNKDEVKKWLEGAITP